MTSIQNEKLCHVWELFTRRSLMSLRASRLLVTAPVFQHMRKKQRATRAQIMMGGGKRETGGEGEASEACQRKNVWFSFLVPTPIASSFSFCAHVRVLSRFCPHVQRSNKYRAGYPYRMVGDPLNSPRGQSWAWLEFILPPTDTISKNRIDSFRTGARASRSD